jgi:hypothetical protein
MPHGFDRSENLLRFEPIQQKSNRRTLNSGVDGATFLRLFGRVLEIQIRPTQTNAVNFP